MIEIRACRGFDELEACVDLEVETWGYDPTDMVPKKTFLLAQKIGGQVIGAFDQEQGAREPENERSRPPRRAWLGLLWRCRGSRTGGRVPRLICTRTCLPCGLGIETRGLECG